MFPDIADNGNGRASGGLSRLDNDKRHHTSEEDASVAADEHDEDLEAIEDLIPLHPMPYTPLPSQAIDAEAKFVSKQVHKTMRQLHKPMLSHLHLTILIMMSQKRH